MSRPIVHVRFRDLVEIGTQSIQFWSGRSGETNELLRKITVAEIPGYIVLTWVGVQPHHEVEVPLSNVTQIRRETAPAPAANQQKEQKK